MSAIALESAKVFFWQGLFFSFGFSFGLGITVGVFMLFGLAYDTKKNLEDNIQMQKEFNNEQKVSERKDDDNEVC